MLNKEIKAVRNSAKNINKVIKAGIEPTKKYHIKDNIHIAWYPARNTTGKRYYWGDREIKRETALKRLGGRTMLKDVVYKILNSTHDYYIIDDQYAFYWEQKDVKDIYIEICNHGNGSWDREIERDNLKDTDITVELLEGMLKEVDVCLY